MLLFPRSEGKVPSWIISAHFLGTARKGQSIEVREVNEMGTGNDQVYVLHDLPCMTVDPAFTHLLGGVCT